VVMRAVVLSWSCATIVQAVASAAVARAAWDVAAGPAVSPAPASAARAAPVQVYVVDLSIDGHGTVSLRQADIDDIAQTFVDSLLLPSLKRDDVEIRLSRSSGKGLESCPKRGSCEVIFIHQMPRPDFPELLQIEWKLGSPRGAAGHSTRFEVMPCDASSKQDSDWKECRNNQFEFLKSNIVQHDENFHRRKAVEQVIQQRRKVL
jgi:hypothetical protein